MQLSIWLNCDKDVSYGRGCKYVRKYIAELTLIYIARVHGTDVFFVL